MELSYVMDTNRYPNFVNKYLKTNKVSIIPIAEWNKRKQELDNVGSFWYDDNSTYFIVPYICPGTFLSPVITNYKIDGTVVRQGMFKRYQIVNITGTFGTDDGGQGRAEFNRVEGVFYPSSFDGRWPRLQGVVAVILEE